MVAIKFEVARDSAKLFDIGDRIFGWTVLATTPYGAHYIVDVPDDEVAMLDVLQANGQIVDWRYEHHYTVQWLPGSVRALAGEQVGDTFPLMGIVEDIRMRGDYGAGVIVGLCDTGVDAQHAAFAGKTVHGDRTDAHGHGTHVASTAASAWGIASDASIWSKNVLPNGSGTEASVANGIRAAGEFALQQRAPMVLNLSLGGGTSSVIDQAVQYAQARGVVVCAAAGNEPNAPIGSPARASDLIVLACDRARNLATFTSGRNWSHPNRCVTPGVNIAAAMNGTRDGVRVASGTSMACPHVVGSIALLISARGGLTPREQVSAFIGRSAL